MGESSSESDSDVSGKDLSSDNLQFVLILKDFKQLLAKSQVPKAKLEKEKAKKEFCMRWTKSKGEEISPKSLMKKIHNLKGRTIKKVDQNRTGNKKIVLTEWEKILLELLSVDNNPAINMAPGAVEVGSKLHKPQLKISTSSVQDEPSTAAPPPSRIAQVVSVIPPPPSSRKKKNPESLSSNYETEETAKLSNQQLQRLVLLEQLNLLRVKRRKLKSPSKTEKMTTHVDAVRTFQLISSQETFQIQMNDELE